MDQGPEAGEHVTVPKNPALLQAVYAGGDPRFVNSFNGDPGDFTNWRWDPAAMDTRITPAAQAQTIMKEVEWSKMFNIGWAGAPTDGFGAMDRFKGMVMFAEAKTQAAFALEHLRNADGLFVASSRDEGGQIAVDDPTVSVADQYQMLQALADVHMVLVDPETYNGVYVDEEMRVRLAGAIDELFTATAQLEPANLTELSLAAQALPWYAATTSSEELRAQALELLGRIGDKLAETRPAGVVEEAQAIRGLVESGRVLGERSHLEAAAAGFSRLEDAYDDATGSFAGVPDLSVGEIGDVLGALNALRVHATSVVDKDDVDRMLVGFFEATVNRGGLMRAVIPKEMEASRFELERVEKDLFFAYPGVPNPDAAGGPNGSAAVDMAELRFDAQAGRWQASDTRYDTAGAMHASNEMLWFFAFVNGYPEVPGTGTDT